MDVRKYSVSCIFEESSPSSSATIRLLVPPHFWTTQFALMRSFPLSILASFRWDWAPLPLPICSLYRSRIGPSSFCPARRAGCARNYMPRTTGAYRATLWKSSLSILRHYYPKTLTGFSQTSIDWPCILEAESSLPFEVWAIEWSAYRRLRGWWDFSI